MEQLWSENVLPSISNIHGLLDGWKTVFDGLTKSDKDCWIKSERLDFTPLKGDEKVHGAASYVDLAINFAAVIFSQSSIAAVCGSGAAQRAETTANPWAPALMTSSALAL